MQLINTDKYAQNIKWNYIQVSYINAMMGGTGVASGDRLNISLLILLLSA